MDNFIDCYLSIGKKNKQAYLLNVIKRNKIFNMPYTVDNFFFKKKNIKNKKKTNFLFVGKLIPRKGCHLLLKAIYILNQRKNFFNQTNFLIVGDGVSNNELKIYAKNNNLDNVKFLGFKNQIGMTVFFLLPMPNFLKAPFFSYKNAGSRHCMAANIMINKIIATDVIFLRI